MYSGGLGIAELDHFDHLTPLLLPLWKQSSTLESSSRLAEDPTGTEPP